MISSPARRILASVLLAVFCFFITPKEVMHAFTHHTDTQHDAHSGLGELQISSPHHHCELLKLDQQFSAFDVSIQAMDIHEVLPVYGCFTSQVIDVRLPQDVLTGQGLRGPPIAMA